MLVLVLGLVLALMPLVLTALPREEQMKRAVEAIQQGKEHQWVQGLEKQLL